MADASVDMTRLQGCNSGVAPRQPDATNFRPTAAWISVVCLPESGVTPPKSNATNFRPTAAWISVLRLAQDGATSPKQQRWVFNSIHVCDTHREDESLVALFTSKSAQLHRKTARRANHVCDTHREDESLVALCTSALA